MWPGRFVCELVRRLIPDGLNFGFGKKGVQLWILGDCCLDRIDYHLDDIVTGKRN